jgi:hypothetical protein
MNMGTFIMTNFRPEDMPNAKKVAATAKPAPKKEKAAPKVEEPVKEDAQITLETLSSEPEANSASEE